MGRRPPTPFDTQRVSPIPLLFATAGFETAVFGHFGVWFDMRCYGGLAWLLAMCAVAERRPCDGIDSADGDMAVYRLPNTTRPVSYELNVTPDYDRRTRTVDFTGEVEIALYATSRTAAVTLNGKHLEVFVVYVREKSTDRPVDVLDVCHNGRDEQLVVLLRTPLQPGVPYAMNVEFGGTVHGGMDGFYRSEYTDDYGFMQYVDDRHGYFHCSESSSL